MPKADTHSQPDPSLIPLGLTPTEVASEFAADLAELDRRPALRISVTEVERQWPFAQGARDDRNLPLVIVQPALLPTASVFANIAARLLDRTHVVRFEEAKAQLQTLRSDKRASHAPLSEREHQFARAMGHGILRFLVGDACISTIFNTTAGRESALTLTNGSVVRLQPSLWLREPKWLNILATFVGHKAQEDTLAPFASAARAGVSLFLLNAMKWEYQTITPSQTFLSEELMEETWCCPTVDTQNRPLMDA